MYHNMYGVQLIASGRMRPYLGTLGKKSMQVAIDNPEWRRAGED